jgi:uncharacterized protein YbjQ (UPF0145 family)
MIKLPLLILACVLIAGCSAKPTSTVTLTGQPKAAVSPSKVTIFSELPEEYTEIASLYAISTSSYTVNNPSKINDVMKQLKLEAAALGANAIVLTDLDNEAINVRRTIYDGYQSGAVDETKYHVKAQALAVYAKRM